MWLQPLQAATILRRGGIVAYPTEAVYGLGCDPFNEKAVHTLCALKKRKINAGLILLAADLQQLDTLIDYAALPEDRVQAMRATWPGPVTWVCPATARVPAWIRGDSAAVAVRVTAHPAACALAQAFAGVIVSTSANHSGCPPLRNVVDVLHVFGDAVGGILEGDLGNQERPTEIRDALSHHVLRSASS